MIEGLMEKNVNKYVKNERGFSVWQKKDEVCQTKVISAEMHSIDIYAQVFVHMLIQTDHAAKSLLGVGSGTYGLTSPFERFSNQGWDVDVAHGSLKGKK